MPKVSVCIPTYNTARYLPEAIESVLHQDFDDYELIICDNASTDETPEICRGYQDNRIRYLRFEEQTNQAGNFNRCINAARGEFITLLHADDYFLPGFIADRVKRFQDCKEVGFVFGAVKVVDQDGAEISVSRRWEIDRVFNPGELLDSVLLGCIVSPPSLMVHKKCIDKAGLFRTDLTWGHDWEWTIRLAGNNTACYGSQPLAAYRVHDASGTAEILSAAKNGKQERRILKDTLSRLATERERLGKLRRSAFQALGRRHMFFAEQALLEQRRAVARNNLWYAMLADLKMLTRPTFWALFVGSFAPITLYSRYRSVRSKAPTSETAL